MTRKWNNKDTISKSMKDKIKNLLKTSKYKSLSLKDPKEQALADTIMKQQSKELCNFYF